MFVCDNIGLINESKYKDKILEGTPVVSALAGKKIVWAIMHKLNTDNGFLFLTLYTVFASLTYILIATILVIIAWIYIL